MTDPQRYRRRWVEEQREQRNPARPRSSALAAKHKIGEFELFCAYHLGITEKGEYRFQNIHQVARRFGTNAGVIRQVLSDLEMDPDMVIHSSFDIAGAQVDIMLAPDGIDLRAEAREMFAQFRAAPRRSRDWAKELEEDARYNERIFGAQGRQMKSKE